MCLHSLLPRERIQKLPKKFTAYKVVCKRGKKFHPPLYNHRPYKETNKILSTDVPNYSLEVNGDRYIPYYHCFRTLRGAREWLYYGNTIIKIIVQRKDVECIGIIARYQVIVTKAFTTKFEEMRYK